MNIQQVYDDDTETRLYASSPNWTCGFDEDERVPLGLYASIELLEDNDHDKEGTKAYPYVVSFHIVAHEPAVNERALPEHHTPEEREKFLTSEEGLGVHGRLRECIYEHSHYGVPVERQLMGIKKQGEGEYDILEELDAKVVENPRIGHPIKQWPWFSNWDDAGAFARSIIEQRADALMGRIGFTLDAPVNRVGQTGWSMIEAQLKGKDWNPRP